MTSHRPLENEQDVAELLTLFYAQVRRDEELGPYFTQVDWDVHTPRIVAFWCGVLFGTPGYQGEPMTVHQRLHARHPIGPQHFARWLHLFRNSVDQLFTGPKAEEAKQRAETIAGVMMHRIGVR